MVRDSTPHSLLPQSGQVPPFTGAERQGSSIASLMANKG